MHCEQKKKHLNANLRVKTTILDNYQLLKPLIINIKNINKVLFQFHVMFWLQIFVVL